VTDDRHDLLISKRTDQSKHVTDAIQHGIRQQIVVVLDSSTRAPTIAAQIWGNGVETCTRQRQQLIPP
jgi:hypothetical protein